VDGGRRRGGAQWSSQGITGGSTAQGQTKSGGWVAQLNRVWGFAAQLKGKPSLGVDSSVVGPTGSSVVREDLPGTGECLPGTEECHRKLGLAGRPQGLEECTNGANELVISGEQGVGK
jgi:hypothetical protein